MALEFPKDQLLRALRLVAERDPHPFYPADRPADLDRKILDQALDILRLSGLTELSEWTSGKGQGNRLTAEGKRVLGMRVESATAPDAAVSRAERSSAWEQGETARNALLDSGSGRVTPLLLFSNLLMFALALGLAASDGVRVGEFLFGAGSSRVNLRLGALDTEDVAARGQWWRIVASGFLHGGLYHLVFNMAALWTLGRFLERLWGSMRFAILYFFAMVAGGCVVLAADDGHSVVGASGALCGLLSGLASWAWLNRDHVPEHWIRSVLHMVATNFVLGVFISLMPNVSWKAHLGGALGGALISFPLHYSRIGAPWLRRASWIAIPALFAAAIALAAARLGTFGAAAGWGEFR